MKVLVSDFDDTLYTNDYEKNLESINKFMQDGNIFIIATGRNFKSITTKLKEKNFLCNFYICKDGSSIYDSNFNLIYRKDIDSKSVKGIIDILLKNNLKVYVDDTLNYLTNYNISPNAIIAKIEDRSKEDSILNEILKKYPVYGYLSRNWINIINKNNSKANAIKFIINKYDLGNDIYVVGDAVNDLSMLTEFNGYVIGDKLKQHKKINNIKELIDLIN